MIDDGKGYAKFTSLDEAAAYGIDPHHIVLHMYETVMCVFNQREEGLDLGFYFSFRDEADRSWTLSVIPADGGVISDALLDSAQEEQP